MTKLKDIKTLYDYIDLIEIRTAMYTGADTLSALYFHVLGYMMACELKGVREDLSPDFGLFHDFVADYYLYGESTAGWKNIILAESYGNEQEALKRFYDLFKLFKKNEKPTNSKKILFALLEKIAFDSDFVDYTHNNKSEIAKSLKDVLKQLGTVKFNFEYDSLLEDVNEIATENENLHQILQKIKEEQ